MSVRLAAHAVTALDTVVDGFAAQEAALAFTGPEDVGQIVGAIMEHAPAEQYPHLAEVAAQHVLQPGYDFGDEFEFILGLALDALEARFASERAEAHA